ncbi:hypothetical protein FA95DRAFT_483739 [Auriscalpium vulgare]|uniref:Uncharacterized protein n=1 Tax=Auriscalpium vulgare TaxID=40419 RepID=A0ACB8SBZ2_9AGAM|nr:hypothetical protein FA95DRAFT_483739 [Auriscalpium vulgare]
MQPYALMHTIHRSHAKGEHSRHSKRKRHAHTTAANVPDAAADDGADATGEAKVKLPRGDYYRRRDTDYMEPKHRKRVLRRGTATLADARAEHVLLAARKIGRERAAILAGFAPPPHRDRDKERKDGAASASAPKTPKKMPIAGPSGSTTGVIYLNKPVPNVVPTVSAASSFLVSTPQPANKSAPQELARNNQRTPLDSLLTAARSMQDDEGDEEDGDEAAPGPSNKPLTRSRSSAVLDSPLPAKRRRVAAAPSASTPRLVASRFAPGPSRTRSALDVLADQAAVFSSKDQDKETSHVKGKGKGKAKAKDAEQPSDAPLPDNRPPPPTGSRTRRAIPEVVLPLITRRPNAMRAPAPDREPSDPPSRHASTAPRASASHSQSRSPPPPPADRMDVDDDDDDDDNAARPSSPSPTLPPALARATSNHVYEVASKASKSRSPPTMDERRADS